MSRWLVSTVAVAGLAGAACSGNPLAPPVNTQASFTAAVSADATDLPANLRDTVTVRVVVTSTRPPLPDGLQVRFDTPAGGLRLADTDLPAASVTATVNRLTGVAEVAFICARANGNVISPVAGPTARITATLQAGGDVAQPVRASGNVSITCSTVEDRSDIILLEPAGGEGNDADRFPVVLQMVDFDGLAPSSVLTINKIAPGDAFTGKFTTSPTETIGQALPFDVTPASGNASFFVVYPGDGALTAGPAGYNFKAAFTNSLNVVVERQFTVRYGRAPNNATISFVDMTPAAGSAKVLPRGTTDPFEGDISAGSASQDALNLKVRITDRNGRPPREGTLVSFTCTAQNNVNNCAGFTGLSIFTPDAGTQSNLPGAQVLSTIEPATLGTEERGVASIEFRPNPSSTPDRLTIIAEFKPINAGTIQTSSAEAAFINLVDNNTVNVSAVLELPAIEATQNTRLTVTMRKGTGDLAGREVCITLDANSFVRGFVNDQDDDTRSNYAMVSTSATGSAEVVITPQSTLTRGPVTITVIAVDQAYERSRDVDGTPCRSMDPTAKTLTRTVQIDREPILASMVYTGSSPTSIGVQGSSIPSTARVTFLVVDDENTPLADQQVSFELDDNGDPSAAVTPFDLTDSSGIAEAFVSAGGQAASLVVRATAVRGLARVEASSDPIAVVGGKPDWANIAAAVQGTAHVYGTRMVTGYDDAFGGVDRPKASNIIVQLSDRFSNRIVRSTGYAVQFRAESGSIAQFGQTNADGFLSVAYIPGPPFAADVMPLGERELLPYRTSHTDAPQDVYRYANPEDGIVTVLIATRGEESFQDVNGNGTYDSPEPFVDANNNGRFDSGEAFTDTNGNSRYDALRETFVDLPEPFLDKNNDGLRAYCDLPAADLPVHRDHALRALGIGTYCNPFFDGDTPANDPELPTAADCRAHWCPDWDPQWNCQDQTAPGGRTPERIPEDITTRATGGRIVWCPTWRYRDFSDVVVTPAAVYLGRAAPVGQYPVDGWMLYPGIHGVVLDDDTAFTDLSSTNPNERAQLRYAGGSFFYRAPKDAGEGTGVPFNPAADGLEYMVPVSVASANGTAIHLMIDRLAFARVLLPGPAGTGPTITATFQVVPGDPRSPFSEFDRSQLRVVQSDQFIDSNNNGQWDDVNGRYDPDTLIWKNLTLLGTGPLALTPGNQQFPSPTLRNRPGGAGAAGLYPRLGASFHAADDGVNLVNYADPTGASDELRMPRGSTRFDQTVKLRLTDANGNAACHYDLIDVDWGVDAFDIAFILGEDSCQKEYVQQFSFFPFGCSDQSGFVSVSAYLEAIDPTQLPLKYDLYIPYFVESEYDPDGPECRDLDGGVPDAATP